MTALTPASVFRRYIVDGVPGSGAHEPDKDEIIALLLGMAEAIGTDYKAVYFATRTEAIAADIPLTAEQVVCLGRSAVGDLGWAPRMSFIRIGASSAAAWRFQSADGQWWALADRELSPEMFGAFANGSDGTAAFAQIATYLNTYATAGSVLRLSSGDYSIWPNAVSTSPGNLCTLSNLKGLTIDYNGSRIVTNNTFATAGGPCVWQFSNCANIRILSPSYYESAWSTWDATKGGNHIVFTENAAPWSNNVYIENLQQNGGASALKVSADPLQGGGYAHGFTVINADVANCYYGFNFQGSGDDFFARGVKMTNMAREYFPWNVSRHDVEMIGDGGNTNAQALLKVYGYPAMAAKRRQLADIKLKYRNLGRINATTSEPLVVLAMSQAVPQMTISAVANNGSGKVRLTVNSTANAASGQTWYFSSLGGFTAINATEQVITVINGTTIDLLNVNYSAGYTSGGFAKVTAQMINIDVDLHVEDQTGNGQPPAIATYRQLDTAAADTTPAGYYMANVNIRGYLAGYNGTSVVMDLFGNDGVNSYGVWSGDSVMNIRVGDLVSLGNSSVGGKITASAVFKNLVLGNIFSAHNWTFTGAGTQLKREGVLEFSGTVTGLSSTRTFTGTSSTVDGYEENVIYNPSNTHTTTLPTPSSQNKDKVILVKTIANFAINSASSNVIPIGGGSAGTAILAATAGKWAMLKSGGQGAAWEIIAQG